MPRPPQIVVMGVSGSGKSSVGEALATALSVKFIDSDSLHSPASIEKMAAGSALTDDDRWPWLRAVGETIEEAPDGIVVACSALRRAYRDAIRAEAPGTFFVHLAADYDLLAGRLAKRTNHFMPPSLLQSQFDILEPLQPDEAGFAVEIESPVPEIVAATMKRL